MVKQDKGPAVHDYKKRIRDSGLRSTGARIAVLRVMEGSASPLTHNEVSGALAGTGFDHATIYRNLTDLTEAGLLTRTDLGDHVWRFELRRGQVEHRQQHPHFLCVDCGEVACLPGDAVQVKPSRSSPKALKGRAIVVQVQGRCDACAAPA